MAKTLIEYSEELLQFLLVYKEELDPSFTCSLRQRNSPQAKDVDRLKEGYWFQGSFYIYIPLFKKGDNARKIKTIGFVVSLNGENLNNYIEISFKDPTHNKDDVEFHSKLAKYFNIKLDSNNVGQKYFENQNDIFENLKYFITTFRTKSLELLGEFNLSDKYLVSEVDFQKYLSKINAIRNVKSKIMASSEIDLLLYKKQIILQGPPGTGKTKLAKELAKKIIDNNSIAEINWLDFIRTFKTGIELGDIGKIHYKIRNSENASVLISVSNSSDLRISYDRIKTSYEEKKWRNSITDNEEILVSKLAKILFDKYNVDVPVSENEQLKLIQFHPSYTYEDFVRGITVKPNPDGDGVLYEAENKILGAFANEAFQNYKLSREQVSVSVSDVELFDLFINDIKEKIADSDEQRFSLTDAVYLFEPDEKRFKYKGDNWLAHSKGLNMKFSELQKIISYNVTERAQVKKLDGLEELTKQHATYFIKVVEMFYEYKVNHPSSQTNNEIKTDLKNYVLIIDEINRANLSSVLGELIYALEYRGEEVDSMYAIDGTNKLILPPNLFIIGTMNTADRSVGHIDYAIRRRFAFVDVLPKHLEDAEIVFHSELFKQVAGLFIKNYDNYILNNDNPLENERTFLSEEFEAKDVWLGHSYFIQKKIKETKTLEPENFNIRVKYEIVPILREYVKDGILNEKATTIINEIEKAYPIN